LSSVCDALNELHKIGFVHRDLKLENIMLESKNSLNTKLVDFGFAEPINEFELISKAGTPGYIPPEIFKLAPYTAKGDVFSVGIIFYSLITGTSAFKGKNYS
jgi:serine/threonine protein kinase